MVLVQVIIMIVLLLLLVVVVLVMVMLLLGLLLLLLMMVIRVGGFVVAAAVLSLYVIAIHDPCVVGVGNFQSSTLLIIGIYPSRYHENKFSLIRSTGKIKTEEEEAATSYTRMLLLADDDNDDAHYGCIAVADAAAAAAAIAAIIAHHNISSGVYASLLAYFGYTDFFFFYFTLCSCNSSHFSHSHCAQLADDGAETSVLLPCDSDLSRGRMEPIAAASRLTLEPLETGRRYGSDQSDCHTFGLYF